MKSEITVKHRQIARAIVRENKPIGRALIEGGISPTQAKKGMARITHTKALRQAVQEELEQWARDAGKIIRVAVPHVRAEMVRARLTMNVARGEDKAVQSCKLLGQDKELRIFEPENQMTINQLFGNCPADWRERFGIDVQSEPALESRKPSQDNQH